MTFISNAKTAAEFRKEVCDHLQREATAIFNRKRAAERQRREGPYASSIKKRDLEIMAAEFNRVCDLRDFFKAMYVEGAPLIDPGEQSNG